VRYIVESWKVRIEKIALEKNLACVYEVLAKIKVQMVFRVD